MPLFRSLISRAARELAQNPETRAKAKQVLDDEVKPRAKQFLDEHQDDIAAAKSKAIRGAAKLAVNLKARLRDK
ncbi:MAG: hypothetical protein R2748_20145 [Bryobacterales bacterium]